MAARIPTGNPLPSPRPSPINTVPGTGIAAPRTPSTRELVGTAYNAIPQTPQLDQAERLVTAPPDPLITLRALGYEKLRTYRWNNGQPLPAPAAPTAPQGEYRSSGRILGYRENRRLQGQASELGHIIEADLVLKSGAYNDPFTGELIQFRGLIFDTVLIEVAHENKLSETDLMDAPVDLLQRTGRRRSVIIRGTMVGQGIAYPSEEVRTLWDMMDAGCSIEVVNDYLNLTKGIYRLALRSLVERQEEGQGNTQTFELTALEDRIDITGGILQEV